MKLKGRYLLFAVIATGLMDFCGILIETAVNVAFPILMREFHVSTSMVQWMTTSYLLVVAVSVPLSAWFYRRFSKRFLFLLSISLFTAGLLLDIVASNFPLLLLGRFIQGAGTGVAMPLMFNIIIECAPKNRIGLMMGIGISITTAAPAIGPTFGGFVVSTLSWRYILILVLPVLIVSYVLGIYALPKEENRPAPHFDWQNYIFLTLFAVLLVLGASNIGNHDELQWQNLLPLVLAFLSLGMFIRYSLRKENPLLNLSVFEEKTYAFALASYGVNLFLILGVAFILPFFMQVVLKATPMQAGIAMLPGSALSAFLGPLAGRILDYFGAKIPIFFGATMIFFMSSSYFFYLAHMQVIHFAVFHFFFMMGISSCNGNIMTHGINAIDYPFKSHANALFNMTNQLCGALGTATVTAVLSFYQKGYSLSGDLTLLGTKKVFLMFMVLAFFSIISLSRSFRHVKTPIT